MQLAPLTLSSALTLSEKHSVDPVCVTCRVPYFEHEPEWVNQYETLEHLTKRI